MQKRQSDVVPAKRFEAALRQIPSNDADALAVTLSGLLFRLGQLSVRFNFAKPEWVPGAQAMLDALEEKNMPVIGEAATDEVRTNTGEKMTRQHALLSIMRGMLFDLEFSSGKGVQLNVNGIDGYLLLKSREDIRLSDSRDSLEFRLMEDIWEGISAKTLNARARIECFGFRFKED